MNKVVLTTEETAAALSVSERKLEKLLAEGKFVQPAHFGDLPRWRVADVLAWIDKNLVPGAQI